MIKLLSSVVAGGLALVAVATAQPAMAGSETGNFMVRVLGTVVEPDASGSVSAVPGNALGLPAGPIAGSDADVSTEVIPALTLSYFLTKNIAIELFCCFAKHQADAEGSISAFGEVADFWIFPPALTLQYHFDNMGPFKPYVGAGLQYIHFFDENARDAIGAVDIDDAVGFTLQAGVDYSLGGGWYFNADVKKTWLETDIAWTDVGLRGNVDVDPWIFSAGLGYRFDLFGSRSEVPLK